MVFCKRLFLVTIFISQSIFALPSQQPHLSAGSVKTAIGAMPRGTVLALLAACALVGYGVYRLNQHGVNQQDELFYPGLQDVQAVVHEALAANTFDQKRLEKALVSLQKDCEYADAVVESGRAPSEKRIKKLATSAHLYRTVYDEVGALDLWVQGYEAYEQDLTDNFQHLPNDYVQKPQFQKLYEELGIITENGKNMFWDEVHTSYNERYKALKASVDPENFEHYCFRPYLRVLQLVFRSEVQKRQYDAYLAGKEEYEVKSEALKDKAPCIRDLFADQLPRVNKSIELLRAEVADKKRKQD